MLCLSPHVQVPLDQFLLGEAGVKFLKRPKGTLSDDEPPPAAIAKVKEVGFEKQTLCVWMQIMRLRDYVCVCSAL